MSVYINMYRNRNIIPVILVLYRYRCNFYTVEPFVSAVRSKKQNSFITNTTHITDIKSVAFDFEYTSYGRFIYLLSNFN